ncbi:unnamed protein product [Ceutorhynchus assimilis]|uniref:BRCT domain-containing protein n=1 Tax=Ceutorhynchus assimilis TaxID=467358 RepID=A0A9N9MM03_9CUCU|nr:unnamed protein product [Ceutorhynchus assimilis]
MKPKVSTGYLTPQGKKPKLASKRHNMSVREEENETPEINSQLVQALLQNPEKKKMILQLLALNKDVIEKHSSGSSLPSSVDKLKSRKVCESPTALMRRRALEKMNNSPNASNNTLLSRPHSSSSASTSSTTTLDKVLEGVKAYVEIKDRHNQDKSQGAKEILKSMGATVVDKLSSEVTHVVFKDGSYKTFQMAKLLKVHIVSILWVEFSRKTLQRAQEKRFPAIGNKFEDETIVCSQMHKEYEDMIRDEYRNSLLHGTPLPSTKALINRRRTLMTPSVSKNDSNNSESSYKSAISTQKQIATINESPDKENLIMNDPEGLSLRDSDMELTNIQNEQTPKRPCNMSLFDTRKTIGHSLCSRTALESNEKAPQLRVSIEKLQLNVRSSSDDSEVCLPATKSRTSLANRRKTLTMPTAGIKRRKSLALDKLQGDSDSSCEDFQAKTATKTRKTLRRITSSDSIPFNTSLRTEELISAGSLKRLKKARKVKHITGDTSDSDNTDIDESLTRMREELVISERNDSTSDGTEKVSKSKLTKKHVTGGASDSDQTDIESVTIVEATLDSSVESLKRGRVEIAALESKKVIAPKKHVTGDHSNANNTDINKKLTSDSSTNSLKQANTRKLRPAKKMSTQNDPMSDSDNDTETRRVAKPAPKSFKKHVTGDSSDSIKSRRLYDPNTSVHLIEIDDEKERQEKREQNKKRRLKQAGDQAGFINPVTVLLDKIAKNATESSDSSSSPQKTPKKQQKKTSNNNTDDEQKQLLDEVLKRPKNIESRRKSVRILNIQSAKKATTSKPAPSTQTRRRSTMDFMSRTQMSAKKKINKEKLPTIVCTKLHRSEVQVFTQIVKKLGRFVVEDEVSEKTTHLVAGEAKRTLNMLRAIARGCWVLKHEWVLRSLEAGKWLPEENFELDDFSPAVRHCRLERQAFGENYAMDVFESCPPIYVSLETTPRCSDLRELIRTCKGKVVTNPRMAMIIVGQYIDGEHVCVTEKWVLDCVNFYEKMDLDDYLIEADNRKRKSFAV